MVFADDWMKWKSLLRQSLLSFPILIYLYMCVILVYVNISE